MTLTDAPSTCRRSDDAGAVWTDLYEGPGMRLVRADYAPGFRHPRHDHSFAALTLILTGGLSERVGTREVQRGSLALTARRAGVEHACDWGDRGARVLSLELDAEALPEAHWRRISRAPWTWVEREEAARCLMRMYESAWRGRLHEEADDLVLDALGAIDEDPPRRDPPPAWLARARDALLARGPKPSTRDLAAEAGIHPVHFARVFRRHLGCSPTELARRGRLRAATEALARDRDREIGRVPFGCGYYDHSHMCRELRQSLGITPTLLRTLTRPIGGADARA